VIELELMKAFCCWCRIAQPRLNGDDGRLSDAEKLQGNIFCFM
jgi:hypothetical protein